MRRGEALQIAIVGAGRIGSIFAFQLAQGGHEVTVVARGRRLAELQADPSIIKVTGERVSVTPVGELDPAIAYDLVLVTVLAHQVAPLLPTLKASATRRVMFMFNTFEKLDRFREAVGASRTVFAFPTVIAFFEKGRVRGSVNQAGQETVVSDPAWTEVFSKAGIRARTEPDMESFFRAHVAFVLPLMAVGCIAYARGSGITWGEARQHARAMGEGFAVVRGLGHKLTPSIVAAVGRTPRLLLTSMLWAASRFAAVRDLGKMGSSEVHQLIDAVTAIAPDRTPTLRAIRP